MALVITASLRSGVSGGVRVALAPLITDAPIILVSVLVVRYLPLHPGSVDVVKILEAARLQGKFWEALEAAYATQGKWAINHQAYPDLFWTSIAGVGLDAEQVSKDMQSAAVAQNIQQDTEDARELGVDKTPGFFVNGKPLVEFGQMQLLQLVSEALEREYGG